MKKASMYRKERKNSLENSLITFHQMVILQRHPAGRDTWISRAERGAVRMNLK